MRFRVGLTDRDWYDYLAAQSHVDEVNFWQPSPRKPVDFTEGEPFLFKLHQRHGDWIAGGGYWAHFTVLPARFAWDVFGTMNGAETFDEMATRIGRYRPRFDVHAHEIGCVALIQPVFLRPDEWIERPADWKPQIQVGRTYDTSEPIGASVWARFEAARSLRQAEPAVRVAETDTDRYGTPALVAARLGQGTFRAQIIDAYERRCAVTGERTLPVHRAVPGAVGGAARVARRCGLPRLARRHHHIARAVARQHNGALTSKTVLRVC
jgi:putative restriction endonuclease